jgi:hypothetical protein
MALSARNQLPGIIQEVRLGEIMAHVVVRVGDNIVESVITRTVTGLFGRNCRTGSADSRIESGPTRPRYMRCASVR